VLWFFTEVTLPVARQSNADGSARGASLPNILCPVRWERSIGGGMKPVPGGGGSSVPDRSGAMCGSGDGGSGLLRSRAGTALDTGPPGGAGLSAGAAPTLAVRGASNIVSVNPRPMHLKNVPFIGFLPFKNIEWVKSFLIARALLLSVTL
jgi:hypothetical protein